MRGKDQSPKAAARLAAKKAYEQRLAQIERTFAKREKVFKIALRGFRPRKADHGKIIFIGTKGGRLGYNTSRKGFAVYVDTKGRKKPIRQRGRDKRLERIPTPRKITTIDVTRARSKRAKKQFLTARLNPVASRELRKKGKGISARGTRYAGTIKTDKFYAKSDSVEILSRDLVQAANKQRSKKDFLITIGMSVAEKNGKRHWIEIQRRFSRQDGQSADLADVKNYFGREIYAFLAKELSDRDLVLQGSARHIARLKENRGKPRDQWRKDGFLWQGHDQNDVKIEKIEYRIDQLKLGK
jgi:hypothetical protein